LADDPTPEANDADVTTQPAISTEEAAATDVELSPVGDQKVEVPADPPVEPTVEPLPPAPTDITVRSVEKREIDVRLLPWNTTISTRQGMEEFAPGSFRDIPDDGLLLMGLEHEAAFGLGQDGQPTMTRRPQGRSTRVWEADDGPYATFRVARTQGGDDILALADDRVVRGVSVEMDPVRNIFETVMRAGRRVKRITRAAGVSAASLTYRPAYGELAAVVAVRSQEDRNQMATETAEVPVAGTESTDALVVRMAEAFSQPLDKIMNRLEAIEERERRDVALPATRTENVPDKGEWAHLVFRMLSGDIIPQNQMRQLDDIITTDNLGVVPSAYLTEIIGVIDASRPFLSTTRRLELPASGMDIKVPKINQRPEVGIQSPEKEEVASQKTLIGTETFDAVSIAGAADISIQILKRSSPAFLSLFVELLAEQYAIVSEDVALDSLANAMGGWAEGNALNPANLNLGTAFINSFDAIRRPPDTIWLSTQAVGEFIDAKATTTNQPLYPSLQASATAAGGISGLISGLRAVHVPTLDDHGAFAIVGPSSGFAWTEAGTYTLQVDVPSKAGRDVGIVGLLFPIPWYPDAFSLYNVAS
jgi:hypothetical protein